MLCIVHRSLNNSYFIDELLNNHLLTSYFFRVLYNRRSKFDPLWLTVVVGGVQVNSFVIFYSTFLLLEDNIISIKANVGVSKVKIESSVQRFNIEPN